MSRLAIYDKAQLAKVLARQHNVISRAQAIECSMSAPALRYRTRPDGPWQVVMPGVYVANGGVLTGRQRAVAAYLYAGRPIAITGLTAVAWHSIRAERSDIVDVLVPAECRRSDAGFTRLHRTALAPWPIYTDGTIRYAPPARAVADAARILTAMPEIRSVVAAAVQQGKVEVAQLVAELAQASPRGTAGFRAALADVTAGARSVAETDLMHLIKRARLPVPMFNARLFADGRLLVIADAWWPEAGVALEVDSREWHLSPADWEHTLARHRRMVAHGILVIHVTPRQLRPPAAEVAAEIRGTLESGRNRPLPQIDAIPA